MIRLASLYVLKKLVPIASPGRQHHHGAPIVKQVRFQLRASHPPISQEDLAQKPGSGLVIYIVHQASNLAAACLELTSILGV